MRDRVVEEPSQVVLLTVDCLRKDAVDQMEFLSELARTNLRAIDCVIVGSGTPTSMPGIVQSRLPTDDGGPPRARRLPADPPTLAEVLSSVGIACGGWHSNVYTSRAYGYERGFDVFADLQTDTPDRPVVASHSDAASGSAAKGWLARAHRLAKRTGLEAVGKRLFFSLRDLGIVDYRPHVRAEAVTDAATSFLPKRPGDGRWFGWLHFMDLHSPYVPPGSYRAAEPGCPTSDRRVWALNNRLKDDPGSLDDAAIDELRALYDANLAYVDDQIKRFVERLRHRGVWEETVLIVTSDHGELFGDVDVPDDYAVQHPNYLADELVEVPLVVAGGSVESGEYGGLVSSMDIPAFVADLYGVDRPSSWRGTVPGGDGDTREKAYTVTGRGQRQDGSEATLPPDTLHASVRTADLVVRWWDDERMETEVEPRGRTAAGDTSTRDASALESALVDRVSDALEGDDDAPREEFDEATRRRLRELGYRE